MESNKEKKTRDYVLVKFRDEEQANVPETIDIVPKTWLHYNKKINMCVTPFPSPPYTYNKIKYLHNKVVHLEEPDSQWKEYPINIVGHASSYEEASRRLQELHEKPYTFTDEENPVEISNMIMQEIKDLNYSDDDSVPSLSDDSENNKGTSDKEKKVKRKTPARDTKKNIAKKNTISQSAKGKTISKGIHMSQTEENLNAIEGDRINLNSVGKVLQLILLGMEEMKSDIKFIKTEIREMRVSQTENVAAGHTEKTQKVSNMYMLKKTYELTFPMTDIDQVKAFDHKLKNNAEFAADFKTALYSIYMDRYTVTKNLTIIFKVLVSRDLLMTYTATKKMSGKTVFKEVHDKLYIFLYNFFCNLYNEEHKSKITEVMFGQYFGLLISGAKDWEGNRKSRKSQTNN